MGGDMATVTSRVGPLIDYLVTLFTNAATLGAAAAPSTVQVIDGPITTMLDMPLKLYVGWTDPDNPAGEAAADSQHTWASFGRLARNEQVTIHCCAEAWSGVDDVKTVRTSLTGITSAVEALLQADTSQFGGNVLFPDPGLTNVSLPQNGTVKGGIARQTFDLVFMCRIGGF